MAATVEEGKWACAAQVKRFGLVTEVPHANPVVHSSSSRSWGTTRLTVPATLGRDGRQRCIGISFEQPFREKPDMRVRLDGADRCP